MPDIDFASLSMSQLNSIIDAAKAEKESRLSAGRKGRLEDALVPIDKPDLWMRAADEKRFVQYFTRRTAPGSKRPTADYYAKTASGRLYRWDSRPGLRVWKEIEG